MMELYPEMQILSISVEIPIVDLWIMESALEKVLLHGFQMEQRLLIIKVNGWMISWTDKVHIIIPIMNIHWSGII